MSFLLLTPIRSFFSIGMSGSRFNVEGTSGRKRRQVKDNTRTQETRGFARTFLKR